MKIEAKITKTFAEGTMKAIADISIDNAILIHGVKLIDGNKGTFISMPSNAWQDKDGNFHHDDIVHPMNSETRGEMLNSVKAAYAAHLQTFNEAQTGIAM